MSTSRKNIYENKYFTICTQWILLKLLEPFNHQLSNPFVFSYIVWLRRVECSYMTQNSITSHFTIKKYSQSHLALAQDMLRNKYPHIKELNLKIVSTHMFYYKTPLGDYGGVNLLTFTINICIMLCLNLKLFHRDKIIGFVDMK